MHINFIRVIFIVYVILIGAATPGAAKENRIALVVGISKYQHFSQLKNTVSDANLLAEKLRAVGFEVALATDLSKDRLARALIDFGR